MSDEKVDRRRGPRTKAPAPLVEPVPANPLPTETLGLAGPVINAPGPDAKGEVRTIHFVEDGWTALGKSWYRGEELSIEVGGALWNGEVDRNGDTWLNLTEDDQLDRYERVYFRNGPWRGKGFDAIQPDEEIGLTEEQLRRLEKRRLRESRPMVPSVRT